MHIRKKEHFPFVYTHVHNNMQVIICICVCRKMCIIPKAERANNRRGTRVQRMHTRQAGIAQTFANTVGKSSRSKHTY